MNIRQALFFATLAALPVSAFADGLTQTTLSGVQVFPSLAPSGGPWNGASAATFGASFLGIAPGGMDAAFITDSPVDDSNTNFDLAYVLNPGVQTYYLFADTTDGETGNFPYQSVGLTFDGTQFNVANGGQVVWTDNNTDAEAATTAIDSPDSTNPGFNVAALGANSLSFDDGINTVSITGFTWYTQNGITADRVSLGGAGADGFNDRVGVLTLEVTSDSAVTAAPEPATFALGFLCLCGSAVFARRRLALN